MNNFWRILFIFQAKLDHLITYLVKMLCFFNGIGLISHSRIGYLLVCFQQRWQISFILGGIYSVNVKMLTRGRSLCVFTILMYFISVFLKPSPEVSVFLIKLLKKLINEKTNGFAKTADIGNPKSACLHFYTTQTQAALGQRQYKPTGDQRSLRAHHCIPQSDSRLCLRSQSWLKWPNWQCLAALKNICLRCFVLS